MTRWFAAVELAAMELPGVPQTERGVQKLAKREGWTSRPREGRGGGREYSHDALPPDARRELDVRTNREAAKQALAVTAEQQSRQIATVAPTSLTARQRLVMEARAAILLELDRRVHVDGVTVTAAIRAMVEDSTNGALAPELQQLVAVANDRHGEQAALSERSLFRWRTTKDAKGVTGLAPELTKTSAGLPSWFAHFLPYYARPQKPTVTIAIANWQRDYPDEKLPTYRQVRIALGKLGSVERQRGRMGAQQLKTIQAYKVRDTSELLPASVYVADGKTYDAEVAHPLHGKPFRPELTTMIDAHTRKAVGFSVSLDENGFGVADALRLACCNVSIPALFYTDRGPGYTGKVMAAPLTGLLARLDITQMKAIAYNSQAKGIIERLNRMWSDDARQYETYLNEDMDKEARRAVFRQTRKELATFGASRTLPAWDEFIANCRAAIERYNNAPHSSLPRISDRETGKQRHMTPNEMWAAAEAHGFEPIRITPDEEADLFRPWIVRRVSRCMVSFIGNSYFSNDLEEYHGRDVILAYDIQDASKVWLREIERVDGEQQPGRLIAIAEFEGNKTRYVPVTAERAAIEKRAKGRERRLQKHIDVVRQETQPSVLLEAAPIRPVLDIAPARELVPAQPKGERMLENGRPASVMDSDVAWTRWMLAHQDQADDNDRSWARRILQIDTTVDILRSAGIDIQALREFAWPQAA